MSIQESRTAVSSSPFEALSSEALLALLSVKVNFDGQIELWQRVDEALDRKTVVTLSLDYLTEEPNGNIAIVDYTLRTRGTRENIIDPYDATFVTISPIGEISIDKSNRGRDANAVLADVRRGIDKFDEDRNAVNALRTVNVSDSRFDQMVNVVRKVSSPAVPHAA